MTSTSKDAINAENEVVRGIGSDYEIRYGFRVDELFLQAGAGSFA